MLNLLVRYIYRGLQCKSQLNNSVDSPFPNSNISIIYFFIMQFYSDMAADDSPTFEETVIYDFSSVSNLRTFLITLAIVAGLPVSVHDFRYSLRM